MLLKNSSVNGVNAFFFMENFCFNLIVLGWDQSLLIMSVSSKMLNVGSSGHSDKSLKSDWLKIIIK